MTVKILLGVLCLSGWLILSKCRQYHFVNQSLDWVAAGSYCSANYVNLANFENAAEMKKFSETVSSAGYNSKIWIGAVSGFNWSDASQVNDDFWKWENQTKNEPFLVYYLCGSISAYMWNWDRNCSVEYPFICYNGTSEGPVFFFVNKNMDWFSALRYCRENYKDLPDYFAYNSKYNFPNMIPNGVQAWMGNIRYPRIYWADNKYSSFRYWDDSEKLFGSLHDMYGVADMQRSGKWRLLPSNTQRPFVCYDNPPEVPKKVIKIWLKLEDAPVDLNDTATKATLLKELQNRLKEKGVIGVTAKWREQPDGAVFHKDGDSTQKERN